MAMKIALIQGPWSGTTGGPLRRFSNRFVSSPPMGLLYLAACVERHGHQADVLDLEVDDSTPEQLAHRVQASGVDLIGMTATTPVFFIVQAYAQRLRELGLPIVLGGPHVTALKQEAFPEQFDYAVTHEGEHTLVELMNTLALAGDVTELAGLIHREGGRPRVNRQRAFIEDLDSLPFPARHKLNHQMYCFAVPGKGIVPVANMALTRGCPFRCAFCGEPQNTGRRLRSRSPKNAVDEMAAIKELGIDHVFMVDSTLTVNKSLIEQFCRELISRKLGMTFEGHTRANLVDPPLLELMKEAGLVRLAFGLESTDPRVLRLIHKEIDPQDVRNAVGLCKRLKIAASIGTMMGNPGETRKTVLATARFVRSAPEIRYAPMAIAVPLPGTELRSLAEQGRHGLKLLETDYSRLTRYSGGVMEIDGMSPAELLKLQRKALIIMHSTPSKLWAVIRHFGFMNLGFVLMGMARSELLSRFTGRDPVLTSVADENTTLKNLGLLPTRAHHSGAQERSVPSPPSVPPAHPGDGALTAGP
jgi:anaerobic magnesium-protoporphyrin IX monomethyl ester cyclase